MVGRPPLHQAFNSKILRFPKPRNVNAALEVANVVTIVEDGRIACTLSEKSGKNKGATVKMQPTSMNRRRRSSRCFLPQVAADQVQTCETH